MDLLFGLVAFVVVLIPLIIIHELGHMLAGKSVGISILEFGIGFPPRMAKLFQWGETEFTLNWVPLGGYVLPYGEDFFKPEGEGEMAERREDLQVAGRNVDELVSVHQAKPLQKLWFLFAGPLANFVGAFIIFLIIPLLGLPTRFSDAQVVEVLPDSPAATAELQPGDTITHVNGEALDNGQLLEFLVQDAIADNPDEPVTLRVDPAEGGETYTVDLISPAELDDAREYVQVAAVQEGTPADEAGLQEQDIILAIDGQTIDTIEEMQDLTDANANEQVTLMVQRGQAIAELQITPEILEGEDRARVGIIIRPQIGTPALGLLINETNIETRDVRYTIPEAVEYGMDRFMFTMEIIVNFPAELVAGNLTAEEARPVSPVGVSQIGSDIIQNRPYQELLLFIALISIALAVTNLLPIPALDGGRILFVLVEMVRGKPMPPEREGLIHLMGFAMMMVLFVVLVINDLANPINLPQ
ncbi:MAG: RIP metalloprotease RseP [Anaerolineales bacterium]